MKLKHYGFFRELSHGDINGISLKNTMLEDAAIYEEEQVNYLKNGVVFIACPGTVRDALNDTSDIIGCPHILTDGVWAWPADLAYYVEKYHARIPDDFVQHMKSSYWTPPNENILNLEELEI